MSLALKPYLDPITAQYLAPLPEEIEIAEGYLYADYLPTDGHPSLVEHIRDTITEHVPDEERIWLEPVRGACEILGLDPLYLANEGRFVMFLPNKNKDEVLSILHKHAVSQEAVEIGEIGFTQETPHQALVTLQTKYGTHRIFKLLSGEQLPRIC